MAENFNALALTDVRKLSNYNWTTNVAENFLSLTKILKQAGSTSNMPWISMLGDTNDSKCFAVPLILNFNAGNVTQDNCIFFDSSGNLTKKVKGVVYSLESNYYTDVVPAGSLPDETTIPSGKTKIIMDDSGVLYVLNVVSRKWDKITTVPT